MNLVSRPGILAARAPKCGVCDPEHRLKIEPGAPSCKVCDPEDRVILSMAHQPPGRNMHDPEHH